jgi:hypothetical protein
VTSEPEPGGPRDAATRIILRLCHELAITRLRYANLLAAAHTTLSAARDDEPAALEYLADELAAQHDPHLDRGPHWWNEVGR